MMPMVRTHGSPPTSDFKNLAGRTSRNRDTPPTPPPHPPSTPPPTPPPPPLDHLWRSKMAYGEALVSVSCAGSGSSRRETRTGAACKHVNDEFVGSIPGSRHRRSVTAGIYLNEKEVPTGLSESSAAC